MLFRLGSAACPVDGDANYDGSVDVNDVSFVLFRLGLLCATSSAMVTPGTGGTGLPDMNMLDDGSGGVRAGAPTVLNGGTSNGAPDSGIVSNSVINDVTGLEVIQAMGFDDFESFDAHVASLDSDEGFALSLEVYAKCLELLD